MQLFLDWVSWIWKHGGSWMGMDLCVAYVLLTSVYLRESFQ